MVKFKEANLKDTLKKVINKTHKNSDIRSILDLGTYYVVSIIPEGYKETEDLYILDGLFKIEKTTMKVSEFSVPMDREAYLKALKNPVYVNR